MAALFGAAALRRVASALRHPLLPLACQSQASAFRPLLEVVSAPLGILVSHLHSETILKMTDTRFPKRRPGLTPRKKRASLKPKGPYAWISSMPGEPVPSSQPNQGSIKAKGRKEKKRQRQRLLFMAGEVKKRKAYFAVYKRQNAIERIERKMAAVARDKAWAARLVELQQLDEKKKAKVTL